LVDGAKPELGLFAEDDFSNKYNLIEEEKKVDLQSLSEYQRIGPSDPVIQKIK
jgi:hypothetical protein